MTKVLVLYYSSYGHLETMADAVAEGARSAGATVDVMRVPETAPQAVVEAAHFKTDAAHPVIERPDVLAEYDAIIVGSPTRFGRVSSQMAAFWDHRRRAVGQGRAARQGRRRVHVHRLAARRAGDDPVLDHHQPAAFRHDDRRAGLRASGPDDAGRDRRRIALWRDDDRGRRRQPPAERDRTGGGALSGSPDCGGCR